MKRLFILPERPSGKNGYAIMVAHDLRRSGFGGSDGVVYAEKRSARERLWGVATGSPSAYKLPSPLDVAAYDEIFIGDTVLLPLLSKSIREWRKVTIRFHNLYLRYLLSGAPLRNPWSLAAFKLLVLSVIMAGVELRALRRDAKEFHFISLEDAEFASRFAKKNVARQHYCLDAIDPASPRPVSSSRRLIWFGGVQAHKKRGLELFISEVLPQLRRQDPRITFELFGVGTEAYNSPDQGILGHGVFPGEGLPYDGDGIFVVPDVEGVGVKIKVRDLLRHGCWFVSTPEGVIGYQLCARKNVAIGRLYDWPELIPRLADAAANSNCRD